LGTSVAEPIFANVYVSFVEVAPGLAFHGASIVVALAVHITHLLEPEVRRAVAAAASTEPPEGVPDAVALAIARSARVVETRGREGTDRVFERMPRCGGHLNTGHALTLELRAGLPDPVI
jgi:hypothetical protein